MALQKRKSVPALLKPFGISFKAPKPMNQADLRKATTRAKRSRG